MPANLTSALQALFRSNRPLITATADTPGPAARLEPGQQLTGHVQSRISEGLFRVRVAGQTFQMRLPANIQSGDTLKLEVVSVQPRITFSMAASGNPLSTPDQIGATARVLSNLADLPAEKLAVRKPGSMAVWQAGQPAPDARLLAGALRETLGKSGLFYESHQGQWVRGERSISQLREEPQNLLTGNSSHADPASMEHPSAGKVPLPVAVDLLQLVQQQLHVLEHRHLAWMGQIWPGQDMRWDIRGQPENQTREGDTRQWSTEVELSLPMLGNVCARLALTENGLRLTLHTTDTGTAGLLRRNLPDLENSLADAGIPLAAAAVEGS